MRIGDITRFANQPEEFEQNLREIADKVHAAGDALVGVGSLGLGSKVYPAIAHSVAEQLRLLARLHEDAIEISANICRTVFEIWITFRFCLSSDERLQNFATQAWTDEIQIYNSVKRLADETTDPNLLALLDGRVKQIELMLETHGWSTSTRKYSLKHMAESVGEENEYNALYGLYSKYVHGSAWLTLRRREHIDLPMYRLPLQVHTQLYASQVLKLLEDLYAPFSPN